MAYRKNCDRRLKNFKQTWLAYDKNRRRLEKKVLKMEIDKAIEFLQSLGAEMTIQDNYSQAGP